MHHIAITSHLPLSHLRSKEFTSVYFTYKPVIRQISYLSDHRIYRDYKAFIMLRNSVEAFVEGSLYL